MELDCIVVCVDYSDYLENTMCWNVGHFDRHTIVTATKDIPTRKVCSSYDVNTLATDAFYENGDKFNKARAINVALDRIKPKDWVLFLDADIVLPLDFGERIREQVLDPEKLYYTCRGTVPKIKVEETVYRLKVNPALRNSFPVKDPGVDAHPWGYFQLVNVKCSRLSDVDYRWMSTHHKCANEYDTEFKNKWPSDQQVMLPKDQFKVLHLGHGPRGVNWEGRVT
jgi:glycosyltransferase involved in cell wall biosynthesis